MPHPHDDGGSLTDAADDQIFSVIARLAEQAVAIRPSSGSASAGCSCHRRNGSSRRFAPHDDGGSLTDAADDQIFSVIARLAEQAVAIRPSSGSANAGCSCHRRNGSSRRFAPHDDEGTLTDAARHRPPPSLRGTFMSRGNPRPLGQYPYGTQLPQEKRIVTSLRSSR